MATINAPLTTARYLAYCDRDQHLIDDTLLALLEQMQAAQRDIAWSFNSIANRRDAQLAWHHIDADMELLGKHTWPYLDHTEVYE